MTPTTYTVPRVEIPGVDPEQAKIAEAYMEAARVERAEAVRFGLKRVQSLTRKGKHIYAGTVPAKVKARRRKADRLAAASRKANR